jgi:hypothetical protein
VRWASVRVQNDTPAIETMPCCARMCCCCFDKLNRTCREFNDTPRGGPSARLSEFSHTAQLRNLTSSPSQVQVSPPTSPAHNLLDHPQWVDFTPTERAYRPRPSPTRAARLHGSKPLPSKSRTRSASSRRRVPLPLRSVLSFVTRTASLK